MNKKANKPTQQEAPEFDFRTIKTFEDACKQVRITTALPDVSHLMDDDLRKPVVAAYKLMVVFKAINNGWRPDWSNWNQNKYYPWFRVLSSGFGFSCSYYDCDRTNTNVGSRLCTDSSEKALYIATQFEELYKDYMLYSE